MLSPDDPATDKQLKYAKRLELNIPANPTFGQVRYLINHAAPTHWQFIQAAELGVDIQQCTTYHDAKKRLKPAFVTESRRIIAEKYFEVSDILEQDCKLWKVTRINDNGSLSLKPVQRIETKGKKVTFITTGEKGRVFSAFTFRNATKH